jgi:SagB-type dehydrogenase family enzyme
MREDSGIAYDSVMNSLPPVSPVSIRTLGQFLELGLGISAWKEFQGSRWALRINPSSGNLHPTEGYLLLGPDQIPGGAGVFHYRPADHVLERLNLIEKEGWKALTEGFPSGTFFLGLSSIPWRESWKYGERAFRYCQHDTGHALAALALSGRLLGWTVRCLQGPSAKSQAELLGLTPDRGFHPGEPEEPELMAAVVPGEISRVLPLTLPASAIDRIPQSGWQGTPNTLSPEHDSWPVIEEVAEASRLSREAFPVIPQEPLFPTGAGEGFNRPEPRASDLFRQRRSAVAMDGKTGMSSASFFQMLSRVLPASGGQGDLFPALWEVLPWTPCVHLALFLHRVEGLAPGLYLLPRTPKGEDRLRRELTRGHEWRRPQGCPEGFPFFRLLEGDARQVAGQISCGQAIASDSAFSLGMIAEFESSLEREGPAHYRRLFWETGFLGQILYLEAEAAGLRATGIGCFFDDPMHDLLGIPGREFQSLYHFTVGGPVEDTRLTTLAPYPAERLNRPFKEDFE